MMDKEAQEKIRELLGQFLLNVEAYNYKRDAPPFEYSASQILDAIKELGYCKLPKDKPPLLEAEK